MKGHAIEPLRSIRAMARPLTLAAAVRQGPCVDAITRKPVQVDKSFFAGAVPVILDQVCDWWNTVEVINGDRAWPDDRLEPGYSSPWPCVWAEWTERDPIGLRIVAAGKDYLNGISFIQMGLRMKEIAVGDLPVGQTTFPLLDPDGLFISATLVIGGQRGHPATFFPRLIIPLHKDRSPIATMGGGVQYYVIGNNPPSKFGPTAAEIAWEHLGIWRLFLALLSVRGTEAVDTPVPRSTRRQWARLPDGPPPWITYKTLSIRLPRATPDIDGCVSLDSNPPPGVPLHLVRGFIADYRSGRGLFGRYKQLVWMPAHLRGHARLGVIAKTYVAEVGASA